MLRATLFVALVATALGGAVELTASNFDSLVKDSGKNAFIKFQAPWWGHCKSMKPSWDSLGSDYEASSSVVIGDADCTVHQDLCSRFSVQGYPTIKYFTPESPATGDDYSGGRDLDSLKKFVADKLEVKCSVEDPTGCSDKEKKFMETFKAKTADDINKQVERLTKMSAGKMKADLKQWLHQRLNILKQLAKGGAGEKAEL